MCVCVCVCVSTKIISSKKVICLIQICLYRHHNHCDMYINVLTDISL